jgi:RHS repeat-associated protein
MWVSNSSGISLSPLTPTSSGAFDPATNRLTGSPDPYDPAGNQILDGPSRSFTYDAENRQVTFNGSVGRYFYDGDGHRVKTIDASGTTVFVYNAGGQLIAEYTTGTPTGGDTSYLTTDHLGSTRVVTDSGGNVEARYDYLPFGGEITVGVGGRSGPMGYGGPDSTRQKFTQKERDSESELDYFLARYYSSAQGRFTGPDEFTGGPEEFWFLGSGDSEKQALPYADIAEPQSLNKYQYCYDNPLRYVDGDGHGVRVKNPFTGLRGKGPAVPKAVQAGLAAVSGPIGLLSLVLDPPREGKTVGDYAEGFLTANAIGSLTGMAHPLLVPLPLPAGGAAVATGGASTALVAAETANAGSPNALVVRGGQNLPENFVNGSGVTKNSNGTLSGVSVNSAPGRTIAELSSGIKNGQIGVTTVGEIRGAGGSITPSATRNNPFHCTVCNLTPDRLSELFTPTIKNPSKP